VPSLRWTRVPARKGGGAGFPPLFLIHGFATTASQCWVSTGWIRRLGADRDLILGQLPWHDDEYLTEALQDFGSPEGFDFHDIPLQDSPDVLLTADDVVDALSEAIRMIVSQHSDDSTGVDLLGYSLGARLAWDLAANESHLVRRVCLGGLPATDRLAEVSRAISQSRSSAMGNGPRDPILEPSGPAAESPSPQVREVLNFVESSPLDRALLERCADRLSVPAFSPGEANVPGQPTLLVSGEADAVADDGSLARLLPGGSRYVKLPRRTHVDALTSGQFARAVRAHLDAD